MSDAVKVVRLFLASPGDLVDERQVAREVADEINDAIRPLRLYVELLGWEDTRPGAGRPQALINKDVDACDLFVGLMWRHWGTPTGSHSSGFEEEFERAQRRRAADDAPDIWLSFKTIGNEHLKDPGPQLRRVLEFRQQQVERREVLFKEFASADEWRNLFRKWLLSFVLELSRSDIPDGAAIGAAPAAGVPSVDDRVPSVAAAPTSLSQLNALAEFIRVADTDSLHLRWPEVAASVVIAHLQMAASAAMAWTYPDVRLGVHEANLVYAARKDLQLAAFERFHIVRSAIADENERVPGWFWFAPADLVSALFVFAADRNDALAKRTFALLGKADLAPTTEYAQRVVIARLRAASTDLREAVLDYLAATSDVSLSAAADVTGIEALLEEVSVATRLRRGDATALDMIEARTTLSERLQAAVRVFPERTAPAGLIAASTSRHEFLRVLAVDKLIRTHTMSDSLAFSLARDTSAQVRSLAFAALLAAGAEIDLTDLKKTLAELPADEQRARLVTYYRRVPLETLLSKLGYLETDAAEIYEAVGLEYAAHVMDRVRRDLATEMSQFYAEWTSDLRAKHGEIEAQAIESVWTNHPDVLTFITNRYVGAALRVIAAKGTPGDIALARRYIGSNDPNVTVSAVMAISRFGSASDAITLVEVAQRSYGTAAALAALAATKLSGNVERVLVPLLRSGNPKLIRPALGRLRKGGAERAIKVLRDLLSADHPTTRILAAEALVDIDRARAERVLDEYQEGYRFYDAVCWLDRLLFAPAQLQSAYRRELAEM